MSEYTVRFGPYDSAIPTQASLHRFDESDSLLDDEKNDGVTAPRLISSFLISVYTGGVLLLLILLCLES